MSFLLGGGTKGLHTPYTRGPPPEKVWEPLSAPMTSVQHLWLTALPANHWKGRRRGFFKPQEMGKAMQLPLKKKKKKKIREPSSLPADRQSPVSSFQYTTAQHFLFPLNVFFVWALSDSLGSLDMVSVIQSGTAWARASRELERRVG